LAERASEIKGKTQKPEARKQEAGRTAKDLLCALCTSAVNLSRFLRALQTTSTAETQRTLRRENLRKPYDGRH
jgi:hypothetical protein